MCPAFYLVWPIILFYWSKYQKIWNKIILITTDNRYNFHRVSVDSWKGVLGCDRVINWSTFMFIIRQETICVCFTILVYNVSFSFRQTNPKEGAEVRRVFFLGGEGLFCLNFCFVVIWCCCCGIWIDMFTFICYRVLGKDWTGITQKHVLVVGYFPQTNFAHWIWQRLNNLYSCMFRLSSRKILVCDIGWKPTCVNFHKTQPFSCKYNTISWDHHSFCSSC